MPVSTSQPSANLEKLINQIFSTRQITRNNQRVLMSLLLSKDALSLEEHLYIDQVFERLRRGLLHVVD